MKRLVLFLLLGVVSNLQCSNKKEKQQDDLFVAQHKVLSAMYKAQLGSGELTVLNLQQQAAQEQQLSQEAIRKSIFIKSESLKARYRREYNAHLLRDMAMSSALSWWKTKEARRQKKEAAKKQTALQENEKNKGEEK